MVVPSVSTVFRFAVFYFLVSASRLLLYVACVRLYVVCCYCMLAVCLYVVCYYCVLCMFVCLLLYVVINACVRFAALASTALIDNYAFRFFENYAFHLFD